jgi:hypothetical protein
VRDKAKLRVDRKIDEWKEYRKRRRKRKRECERQSKKS